MPVFRVSTPRKSGRRHNEQASRGIELLHEQLADLPHALAQHRDNVPDPTSSEARHQLQEVTRLAGEERQVLAAAGFLARADRDATAAMLERQQRRRRWWFENCGLRKSLVAWITEEAFAQLWLEQMATWT